LQRAVNGSPDFAMALVSLGRAYSARYRLTKDPSALDSARVYLERGLEAAPHNVYTNVYAGRLYSMMELPPRSIECFKTALATAPGHPESSMRLAWIYDGEGRFDEAESLFLDSIRRYADFWATYFELGVLYYYHDRTEDALANWKKALDYAPGDVTTLSNIGAVYHGTGRWQLARQYFQRAFQISPTCETCSNMGLSYYFRGEYEEAARYYEFALEYCDTTEYDNWGNLAASLFWVDGQRERALETYRRAIRLAERARTARPDDHAIIRRLIDYYAMSGDRHKGLRMIAYGDSVAGDDASVLFRIGDAYELFGERQLALRYIGNALRRGYSLEEIETTPTLRELIKDPVFQEMRSTETREDSASATTTSE
jgi:serine/threonine-protein kinase